MRPIALVFGVLLLAALAFAWWTLRPIEYSKPTVAGPVSAADSTRQIPAPEDLGSPAEQASSVPAPATTQRSEAAPAQSLPTEPGERLAAAAPDVTATGQVLDDQGRPVPDARVILASGVVHWGAPLDAPTQDSTQPASGNRNRKEAKTDAKGRFEIAGLKPGSLRAAVRKSGFAPLDATELSLPAEATFDLGTLTLVVGVEISGRVVDHTGRGVAGAKLLRGAPQGLGGFILMEGPDSLRGSPAAVSAADGTFLIDQLAAGPFRLRVTSEDHPTLSYEGSTQRPGERIAGLTLQMEQGFTIEGSVQGASAQQLKGLRLRAGLSSAKTAEEAAEQRPFVFDSGLDYRTCEVQADGRFGVRGLRAGRKYQLSTRKQDTGQIGFEFGSSLTQPKLVTAGDRGVVLTWMSDATLLFRVVDAKTRQPVTSLSASASFQVNLGEQFSENNPRAYPEGLVSLDGLRPPKLGDRALLNIVAPGYKKYEQAGIAVQVGDETNLGEIALEPAAALRIEVRAASSGQPVANARLQLKRAPKPQAGNVTSRSVTIEASSQDEMEVFEGVMGRQARTDAKGRAVINAFEDGDSILTAAHEDFAPSTIHLAAVGSDGKDVAMALGQGGSVRIQAFAAGGEPAKAVHVEHRSGAASAEPSPAGGLAWMGPGAYDHAAKLITDSQGVVEASRLEPGVHRFRVADGAGGPSTFSSADGEMEFSMGVSGLEEEQHSNPWIETLVSENVQSSLELQAPVKVAVSGTVREAGAALAGASVSLRKQASAASGPEWMSPPAKQAKTDGNGKYRMEGVAPGEWAMTIKHPTRSMPSTREFTLGANDHRLDLELDLTVVEGRVLDAAKKPVAGAKVWAEELSAGGPKPRAMIMLATAGDGGDGESVQMQEFGAEASSQTTDQEGRYSLRGVDAGKDLVIKASAKDFQPGQSKKLDLSAGQHKTGVEVELASGGKLEVRARHGDGKPAKYFMVRATFVPKEGVGEGAGKAENTPEPKSALIQADGKTTLEGLAPGIWKVNLSRVVADPGAGESEPIPDQQALVSAGELASLEFVVP